MFKLIQQNLETIPAHGQPNYVVHSLLNTFSAKFSTNKFAIKYVVEGIENYTINEQKITLETGQYLLSKGEKEGTVLIDSKKTVQGICVYLYPELLAEVFASLKQPDTAIPDIAPDNFFNDAAFLNNKFYTKQTNLGSFLNKFSTQLNKADFLNVPFNEEFYFTIAELVIHDYRQYVKQLQNIATVKPATKNELLKKLTNGKEYMDSYFTSTLKIETIAKAAQISEYHFYRLFKTVYGISPLQYLIKKRLELAHQLLQKHHQTVTEVGLEAGFTDIYSFSRIYKKHYGENPSSI